MYTISSLCLKLFLPNLLRKAHTTWNKGLRHTLEHMIFY